MNKRCIGCGKILQDQDKSSEGYTPNLKNEYCMRCFRLKNYGEKKICNITDMISYLSSKNGYKIINSVDRYYYLKQKFVETKKAANVFRCSYYILLMIFTNRYFYQHLMDKLNIKIKSHNVKRQVGLYDS